MSELRDKAAKLAALLPSVKLREHQEEAIRFIEEGGGRGLLAHGTGSGKGLSAVAAVENLREKGMVGKTLVVTPAALQDNFSRATVQKFTDNTVGEVGSNADYQVMSVDKFRKDPHKFIDQSGADTLVVDEIHRAKDPQSVTNKALRKATTRMKNVIGLTGSFISNHPREVVPLMDIVQPGHDFGSQQAFQKRHTKKTQVPGGFLKGPRYETQLQRKGTLGKGLSGSLHYLGHEDIAADMPRMEVESVHVPMSKEQNKLYNFALGKLGPYQRRIIRDGLPASQSEAQHILATITKARQAANSIGTHKDTTLREAAEQTPKLKQVMDDVQQHLKDTSDGQAVVYTNLVQGGADALMAGLKGRGVNPGVFAGVGTFGLSKEQRQKHVDDFKDGKKNVIVLTPAASEGVSLNNATGFFEVDRHYNPERNQQAIARGRRLGGQAHRKPEDRVLEVKRYYSDPIPGIFRRMLGMKDVGVDEWISRVAKEKDRLNKDMRQVVHDHQKSAGVRERAEAHFMSPTVRDHVTTQAGPRGAVKMVTDSGKTVVRRNNPDGSPINLSSKKQYDYWAKRRMVGAFSEFGDTSPFLLVDLDPGQGVQKEELRTKARLLSEQMEQVGAKPQILSTGGKGMHVRGYLDEPMDINKARILSRDIAKTVEDKPERPPAPGEIRFDTSPLKRRGLLRIPGSYHEATGNVMEMKKASIRPLLRDGSFIQRIVHNRLKEPND